MAIKPLKIQNLIIFNLSVFILIHVYYNNAYYYFYYYSLDANEILNADEYLKEAVIRLY